MQHSIYMDVTGISIPLLCSLCIYDEVTWICQHPMLSRLRRFQKTETLFGSPCNKDHSILGFVVGPLILENSQLKIGAGLGYRHLLSEGCLNCPAKPGENDTSHGACDWQPPYIH